MTTQSLSLRMRLCFATLALAAGSACSQAPHSAAPAAAPAPSSAPAPVGAATPTPSASLAQQIDAEIGTAACDTAQQCRTLPVGSKACGGPAAYRAWSAKSGDGARLSQLAAQQAEQQKKADSASGRLSTCSVVTDPGATCTAGRCVLNKPGTSAQ